MKEWWGCGRRGGGGGGGQYGDWFPRSAGGHLSRAEHQGALKGVSELGPMEVCQQRYITLHHC